MVAIGKEFDIEIGDDDLIVDLLKNICTFAEKDHSVKGYKKGFCIF